MKKSLILFLLILFLFPCCVGAKEIKEEVFNYGGRNSEEYNDVIATSDGGYVAVGYTSSTDIDGLSKKSESDDGVIVKYDKNNKIEWQNYYSVENTSSFESVVEISDGYIAVGYIHLPNIDEIDFKGGLTDAIVVKYDKNGKMLWQKNYGGSSADYFYDVLDTLDGGYIVVGQTNSTDMDGITLNGSYYHDGIIIKFNKDEKIEWQKSFGGSKDDLFNSITETLDGGYVAVGSSYSSNIDGITSKGENDAIVVKYDKNGNIIWKKNYGGSKDDSFEAVSSPSDGGVIVVGHFNSGNVDGIKNNGYIDAVIVKYDKDGNIVWQNNYGGSNEDLFEGVIETTDGGYVAVGGISSSNIEGIQYTGSFTDTIVVKYDNIGNMVWQKNYGGDDEDLFRSVVETTSGEYVSVGYIYSSNIVDIKNKGYGDAFVAKIYTAYDFVKEETDNGSFEVTQEGNLGKITIHPDAGYELDEIIITDSQGNKVEYYEENGNYYFKLSDDVKISVTFRKKIENPNTGSIQLFELTLIIALIAGVVFYFRRKKKFV